MKPPSEDCTGISVKGADAYYLAVAEITKSHLYTFDHQQKEAFEVISKNW
jgi:predicted nucleic acid-binding protein